jgi:2-methylcitrate dehydratase PrpD
VSADGGSGTRTLGALPDPPLPAAPGLTLALAERSSTLGLGDIPEDVLEIARQCLLDWFAVALGGSSQEAPRTLLEILDGEAGGEGGPSASVVGHRVRLSPLAAALVNGTASHALDFDDVNLTFLGHVSVGALAAALALAEQVDAGTQQLLVAFVAGYESACRIAAALGPEPYLRGQHATGTIGTFGAAAACARLLALERPRTATALGIAASEAAGLKCSFGTMTKSLHAGRAAQSGLLAALLAGRGFTASACALEDPQGFATAAGGALGTAAALGDPPSGWHLRDNLFKHHAACFFTHSAIEGLRELCDARALPAETIERVVLHIGELEQGACAIAEPQTALEVKFSIAHLAAMALLGRPTSCIGDEDAFDPAVIALRERVALAGDGAAGAPTRVEVVLRSGQTLTSQRDVSTPMRDLPAQRKRLGEKFTALARPVLGAVRARELLDALEHLGAGHSVRQLMALARP